MRICLGLHFAKTNSHNPSMETFNYIFSKNYCTRNSWPPFCQHCNIWITLFGANSSVFVGDSWLGTGGQDKMGSVMYVSVSKEDMWSRLKECGTVSQFGGKLV